MSNQLLAVADASSNTLGFVDGNTSGNDYSYNADGSLNKDLNRKITSIAYNVLKLPRQVSFSTGTTVSYQYDATGKKLRMSLSGGDSRDYVGPVEYLNSSLLAIKHPEGRLAQGTTYEYFLTDHLGNIRAVATNSGVTQWTEYDPWGMELAALSSGTSTNRDRFNGKEALAEIGNGMLDYGARLYDATIGRWGVIDPLAEKATHWSPYRFGFDNPVSVTDPTGMFEYSNGYSTQDSKDITGAMEFNGVFQNGGGDGPGKGKTNAQQQQADRQASYRSILPNSPNLQRVYAGMSPQEKAEAVGGSVDAIESDNATNFAMGSMAASAFRAVLGRIFGNALQQVTAEKSGQITVEEGSYTYRSLTKANAESLSKGQGIFAKAPSGSWTLEEHLIHGSSPKALLNNPWIATSSDINIARSFSSGNGLIRVDLSKLPASSIQRGWLTLPRSSAGYHYSIWQQEVSILGHIPQSAIQIIK